MKRNATESVLDALANIVAKVDKLGADTPIWHILVEVDAARAALRKAASV